MLPDEGVHADRPGNRGIPGQQIIHLFTGHILDIFIQYGKKAGIGGFGYPDAQITGILGQGGGIELIVSGIAE